LVNLLITMRCNRACSYCFAKEKLHSYSAPESVKNITLENFNKVLDFLLKSNQNVLQLAGGEPTIHPQFKEMLLALINKKMREKIIKWELQEIKKYNWKKIARQTESFYYKVLKNI